MAVASQLHKFTVECSAVLASDETIDLNGAVTAIAIKKDFLNNIFPLYVISLSLSDSLRRKLIENEFYLSLKIYRITVTELAVESDVETTSSPTTDKIITSILLRPFDNPKIFQKQKSSDVDDSDSEDVLASQMMSYTINCVPKEQLQINSNILNACYNNSNMSEIVLNLLSEVYTKDTYFQESFNNTRYKSLLIPPGSIVQSLRFLQENYMIYKYNLNMFFEFDRLYLYDIFDLNREFRNSFSINIDSDPTNSDQEKYSHNFVDDNENVQKYLDTNPVFFSKKDISGYKKGNKIIVSSYDDNFNLVTRQYNDDTSASDMKTRVIWNKEQAQSFERSYNNRITEISQISLANFDPTYIEPDTMINISGSEQAFINGTYILSGIDVYFSSEDKKTFSNTVSCNLIKYNKIRES